MKIHVSNNSKAPCSDKVITASGRIFSLFAVAVAMLVANNIGYAEPAKDKEKPQALVRVQNKDPFAGDTWHAVRPSWPGTIKFDSSTKKVVLEPVGAPAINATYTYTFEQNSPKSSTGTLTMTNLTGQVSSATFEIKGKNLTLNFAQGSQQELYVRMTASEEQAATEKLKASLLKPTQK